MTDIHSRFNHPSSTDTSITLFVLEPGAQLDYIETPFKERRNDDIDFEARSRKPTEADALLGGDGVNLTVDRSSTISSGRKSQWTLGTPTPEMVTRDLEVLETDDLDSTLADPQVEPFSYHVDDTVDSNYVRCRSLQDVADKSGSNSNPMHRDQHQDERSVRLAFHKTGSHPEKDCPASKAFCIRFSNFQIIIIIVCSLSTIFSAVFVALAVKGQRYEKVIDFGFKLLPCTSGSQIEVSTAILLTATVAMFIELSFVTAFVTFLGQILSRTAFMEGTFGTDHVALNCSNWNASHTTGNRETCWPVFS